jgi:hypothetical protein
VPAIEGGLHQAGAKVQVEPPHRLNAEARVTRRDLRPDALAKAVGKPDERRLVELRARLELVVALGDAARRSGVAFTRRGLRNRAISSA